LSTLAIGGRLWSQQLLRLATIRRLFVWQVVLVIGLHAFVVVRTTEVSCGKLGVANPQFGTEAPLRSGFVFPINCLASCSFRQIRKAHPVALTIHQLGESFESHKWHGLRIDKWPFASPGSCWVEESGYGHFCSQPNSPVVN
jgi:hypothetical protein